MKPLFLAIQGINSYESRQEIDFTKLLSYGIFGIFGSTGSGKSTILDAITLALYGVVSRLPKSASKHFINTNCDKAEVMLKFEIESTTYCVHRAYKKTEKNTRTALVRFYRVHEGFEEVIADKNDKEVTSAVEKVIGLEYDDFIRSVVLPQGKFSEFLLLTSGDRRSMLERIFKLEQYGEALYSKVRLFSAQSKSKIESLNQNISIYGNISQTIIGEAENSLKNLSGELERLESDKAGQTCLFEKYRELRTDYLAYTDIIKNLNQLKILSASINEKKEKLSCANKALPLYNIISETENIRKRLKTAENDKKKLLPEFNTTQLALERAKSEYDEAVRQKDNKMQGILENLNKLEQAKQLKIELDALNAEMEGLQNNFKLKGKHEKAMSLKLSNIKNLIDETEIIIEKLLQDKKGVSYSAAQRKLAIEGLGYEKEMKKANTEIKKLQSKISVSANVIASGEKAFEAKTNEIEKENKILKDKLDEISKTSSIIDGIELKMREKAIYFLNKSLEDGKPCPVCGSTEHSKINIVPETETANASGLEAEHENLLKIRKSLENTASGITAKINKLQLEAEKQKLIIENETIILKENTAELCILKQNTDSLHKQYEQAKASSEKIFSQIIKTFDELYEKINNSDNLYAQIESDEQNKLKILKDYREQKEKLQPELDEIKYSLNEIKTIGTEKRIVLNEKGEKIKSLTNGKDIDGYFDELSKLKLKLAEGENSAKLNFEKADLALQKISEKCAAKESVILNLRDILKTQEENIQGQIVKNGFSNEKEVLSAYMKDSEIEILNKEISNYEMELNRLKNNASIIFERLKGENLDEILVKYEQYNSSLKNTIEKISETAKSKAVLSSKIHNMKENLEAVNKLKNEVAAEEKRYSHLAVITSLCRNNAFLGFVSQRQLQYVALEATSRLRKMTGGRYAVEIDNSEFLIRDNFNAGVRRLPASLSGGEVFIVSLCLALALSSKIQMRSNTNIRFFFLDEGFGTLDSGLLDTVMDSLEMLRTEKMAVGLISHVDELKSRIHNKITVEPANYGISGSKVVWE